MIKAGCRIQLYVRGWDKNQAKHKYGKATVTFPVCKLSWDVMIHLSLGHFRVLNREWAELFAGFHQRVGKPLPEVHVSSCLGAGWKDLWENWLDVVLSMSHFRTLSLSSLDFSLQPAPKGQWMVCGKCIYLLVWILDFQEVQRTFLNS